MSVCGSVSLVRIDDGCELPLGGPGEYTLGRGPLVKITDKRVSRNHALIRLKEGGISEICPKHTNPFFYMKSGADKFVTIPRNEWHSVKDNDQISFLPNELIYKVKVINPSTKTDSSPVQEVITSENSSTVDISATGPSEGGTGLGPPVEPCPLNNSQSISSVGGTDRRRNLPTWMSLSGTSSIKKAATAKKAKQSSVAGESKKPKLETTSSVTPTIEDHHKKVATTVAESVSSEKTSKKTKKSTTTSPTTSLKDDGSIGDKPVAKKKLPRCPYGTKCYRKNPAHFNEYSHEEEDDSEEDEEEGDKPECPYGTSCYRVNPVHRQQFKHTAPPAAGSKRVRTSTRTRKKPKRSVLSGDSDDEGEPNTYDYNDSFIDDEDELGSSGSSSSTSFKGDSEDEDWCLPQDEDMAELVSEAKTFITNKKMHRTS